MAYRNSYTFKKVFNKNGERSKWSEVVAFLAEHGPASKIEILNSVYPDRGDVVDRGYCSNMFANLNDSEYVYYNTGDRKWHANTILEHIYCRA